LKIVEFGSFVGVAFRIIIVGTCLLPAGRSKIMKFKIFCLTLVTPSFYKIARIFVHLEAAARSLPKARFDRLNKAY